MDRKSTEAMLKIFGNHGAFAQLAGRKGFILKTDIDNALINSSFTKRVSLEHTDALLFMQYNFNDLSELVEGQRGITKAAMYRFAQHTGITWSNILNEDEVGALRNSRSAELPPPPSSGQAGDNRPVEVLPNRERQVTIGIESAKRAMDNERGNVKALEMQVRRSGEWTINNGDTLWAIAEKKLQNDGLEDLSAQRINAEVHRIKMLNGLEGSQFVQSGQILHLYSEREIQTKIDKACGGWEY